MISVKMFNNFVKNNFLGKPIILASYSSAVYLGLTYLVTPEIYIYNPEQVLIQETKFKIIELDYKGIDLHSYIVKKNGMLCTNTNLTIIDMIKSDSYTSICLESLKMYYYQNSHSFLDLMIPDELLIKFNSYIKSIKNEESLDY